MVRRAPRLYLAGPEVFLRDAVRVGEAKKALCARYGFEGLTPLDGEVPDAATGPERARVIFRANDGLIRGADAVVANLTPFRGPSADPGTVLEVGLAFGLGLPVFAYSNDPDDFETRTRAWLRERGFEAGDGDPRDHHGLAIECFDRVDNLMIDEAVAASGGCIERGRAAASRRYADLGAFEACLRAVVASGRLGGGS